jgi:hypothetical protein
MGYFLCSPEDLPKKLIAKIRTTPKSHEPVTLTLFEMAA